MTRQIPVFVAVGSAAACVHIAAVAFLVEAFGVRPLAANALAFLLAFCVSYAGHATFTFPGGHRLLSNALPRFFAVAAAGFALNQVLYANALQVAGERFYLPALAVVLVAVAAMTFLLSKLWAFARPPA